MTKHDKVAGIICFLSLLFGEESHEIVQKIMNFSPDYILEKFDKYVDAICVSHNLGMHPNLKEFILDKYVEKWGLKIDDDYSKVYVDGDLLIKLAESFGGDY